MKKLIPIILTLLMLASGGVASASTHYRDPSDFEQLTSDPGYCPNLNDPDPGQDREPLGGQYDRSSFEGDIVADELQIISPRPGETIYSDSGYVSVSIATNVDKPQWVIWVDGRSLDAVNYVTQMPIYVPSGSHILTVHLVGSVGSNSICEVQAVETVRFRVLRPKHDRLFSPRFGGWLFNRKPRTYDVYDNDIEPRYRYNTKYPDHSVYQESRARLYNERRQRYQIYDRSDLWDRINY